MTDYYVDAATGSDGNTGGVGDPWLTIQFAVNQCAGAGKRNQCARGWILQRNL